MIGVLCGPGWAVDQVTAPGVDLRQVVHTQKAETRVDCNGGQGRATTTGQPSSSTRPTWRRRRAVNCTPTRAVVPSLSPTVMLCNPLCAVPKTTRLLPLSLSPRPCSRKRRRTGTTSTSIPIYSSWQLDVATHQVVDRGSMNHHAEILYQSLGLSVRPPSPSHVATQKLQEWVSSLMGTRASSSSDRWQ